MKKKEKIQLSAFLRQLADEIDAGRYDQAIFEVNNDLAEIPIGIIMECYITGKHLKMDFRLSRQEVQKQIKKLYERNQA